MKRNNENNSDYLVQNPFTNQQVDISSLWEVLNHFYSNSPGEVSKQLEIIIRKLSLEHHPNITREEEKHMLFDLYNLKDMFDDMGVKAQ
jgi:hypothetical protein